MLIILLPEAEAEAKSTLSGALDRHADRNPSLQFIRHRTPSPVQWKAELKATHSGLQRESETVVNIYYWGRAEPGAHATARVWGSEGNF